MLHHHPHPREQQLSATPLTPNAESGHIAREIGFLPKRQARPPVRKQLPIWHVAYAHPPQRPSAGGMQAA